MKASRILSALLATVMLLSICVTGVYAAEKLPFTDVSEGDWFYEAVMYAYDNGIMNGTGNGTKFSPGMKLTRGMVVTVLYRMEGEPELEYDGNLFSDVAEGLYYSLPAMWAKEEGIVTSTGTDDIGYDLFSPDRDITRQELATMIGRYASYKHVSMEDDMAELSGFADSGNVATWAADTIRWTVGTGIITGKSIDSKMYLAPVDPATRAEFATVMFRYLDTEFVYEYVYSAVKPISSYTEPEYPLVKDADIYVSVEGNDNAAGTFEKPIATFERAVEMVRELKAKAKDGVTVAFMAGNYGYLDLTLDEADSGSAECPITYCAYGDGEVLFSNGVQITLDEFVPLDEDEYYLFPDIAVPHIKKADLSDRQYEGSLVRVMPLYGDYYFGNGTCNYKGDATFVGILYDEEQSLELARFPNKISPLGHDKYIDIGKGHHPFHLEPATIIAAHLANYHTYDNIQYVGRFGAEYESNFAAFDSYDKEKNMLHLQEWVNGGISSAPEGYLMNISEELDCEGEYWTDVENEIVYVYNPTSPTYSLATEGTFITINGADHISFIGLDFKHSNDEAIIVNADHVTIENAEIFGVFGSYLRDRDRGTYAVLLDGYGNAVKNCEITHLGGGGITVSGGDHDRLIPSETVIDNNLISHFGQHFQAWTPGVRIFDCVGATVSHNEISHSQHQAIHFDRAYTDIEDARCINNIIEYNYIHDVCKYYGDAGAIYTGGTQCNRGNVIRYNIIAAVGSYSWGLYLDDGISGQSVYGNIFNNSGGYGILHSGGRDNYVCDNYFIRTTQKTFMSFETPLRIWAKYSEQLEACELDVYNGYNWSATWESVKADTLRDIPDDPECIEIWKAEWPELFDAIADTTVNKERLDDPNMMANSAGCTIKNNHAFGAFEEKHYNIVSPHSDKFNVVENNNIYFGENDPQIFVNPALGNYSVKEGSSFASNHFDKIGRY